jgi:transposase-like protein
MTATIRRVARPRGELTDAQLRRLSKAAKRQVEADAAYRAEVVVVLAEGASFAEVSKATGLSTNTLQRWKREAR